VAYKSPSIQGRYGNRDFHRVSVIHIGNPYRFPFENAIAHSYYRGSREREFLHVLPAGGTNFSLKIYGRRKDGDARPLPFFRREKNKRRRHTCRSRAKVLASGARDISDVLRSVLPRRFTFPCRA